MSLAVPGLLLFGAIAASGQRRVEPPAPLPPRLATRLIAEADAHYRRRDALRQGMRADPREVGEAISLYEEASRDPEEAEARWKLSRALYFRGRYTGLDRQARKAVFEKSRRISEEAIGILASRARARGVPDLRGLSPSALADAVRRDPDASPTYFWAGVAWGEWALAAGRIEAAKTRAATRIRDYARTVIALDSSFEEGGGYRVLGRLHHQAPRIPLVTGWVSREEALRNLRLAVRTAPHNFVNRHFLAELLAERSAAERAEAIRIERSVLEDAPSPSHMVEALAIQEEARGNLERWRS
jgi:tetratricopeptide (TPR) repeat protein